MVSSTSVGNRYHAQLQLHVTVPIDMHVDVARRAIDRKLSDSWRISISFRVTLFPHTYVVKTSSAVTSVTSSRFVHSMLAPTVLPQNPK